MVLETRWVICDRLRGVINLKGLVKYARGDGYTELREVEQTHPASNEVVIAVKAAGVCGSDLHIYHDEMKTPLEIPVVIGHEFSGKIIETGSEVEEFNIGDRVTAIPNIWTCGKCRYCRSGYINLCSTRRVLGYSSNGAFAEYCTVPMDCLYKLPENVDFLSGALTEPLACCTNGVIEQTGISAGDLVVITGPGAIGLLTMQLAKAEGGIVAVCGVSGDEKRLQVAQELGADYTIRVDKVGAVETIKEVTDGYGADVVLECSGSAAGASLALNIVRKRGKYTQMGLFGHPIEIDFELIAYKELQVTGFVSQKRSSWERAIKLMACGKILTKPLISHELTLDNWKHAFEMFEQRGGVKLILIP